MGLRINTNIVSIKATRHLERSTSSLNRALERLASGSRINKAGDDAAGLAVSEGLRSQVRGLRAAVRNANDAIGFFNTAEGALSEMTNISQRLRELAVQASNGTISESDRGYLNLEAQQLIQEFDRIASQTEFNGSKLLDGTFSTRDLQVGVNQGDTLSFSLGDARANVMGTLAIISGTQHYLTSSAGAMTMNGVLIAPPVSTDDTISTAGNAWSAIAVAATINKKEGQTGVRAIVLDNIVDLYDLSLSTATWSGTIDKGEFSINGIDVVGDNIDTLAELVDAINSKSQLSGVRAQLLDTGSTANDIQLVAVDGRNINIQLSGANSTSFYATLQAAGTVNFGAMSLAFGASSVSASWSVASRVITGAIKLVSADEIELATSSSATLGFAGTEFQIDTAINFATIDISTQADAGDSLDIVDAALDRLAAIRASLGAVQNRLEATISGLTVANENLTAAASEIRDADMALETAELTKAQILQQAGIAVLAQANTSAQAALQLLQG